MFKRAYFKDGWEQLVDNYQSNKLTFNADKTKEWLEDHLKGKLKYSELVNWLSDKHVNSNISDIGVFVKLESLLKDEPIWNWAAQ